MYLTQFLRQFESRKEWKMRFHNSILLNWRNCGVDEAVEISTLEMKYQNL